MEDGTRMTNNDVTFRCLLECLVTFKVLTSIVNSSRKERFITEVAEYGIQDDGSRLRLLIRSSFITLFV